MAAILKRVGPILKIVGTVFQNVALVTVFGVNMLMVYIMFAPDDLPKPFYLNYEPRGMGVQVITVTTIVTENGSAEANHEYKPGEGLMVETGTKVVNLADPLGRRFLKATVTLEVAPTTAVIEARAEAAKSSGGGGEGAAASPVETAMTAFSDEMTTRLPVINDVLTTLLSSKTFDAIYTMEGKETLRGEILAALNERMPELHVIAVYFTEFVVQ